MRKRQSLLAALCILALLLLPVLVWANQPPVLPAPQQAVSPENRASFSKLLDDLVSAYRTPETVGEREIAADLAAIRAVSEWDYALAENITAHWRRVWLDPDYRLYLYHGEERAEDLLGTGIPDSPSHAIVVLGYELQDGEMQPELKGRREAAAAVARAFPRTILVCSGGATGDNNPEGHTEAGLMKAYLTGACGIEPDRIFIDERAMTTQENAVNSLRIMQENGVHSMTIVTSDYHQRWGQAVYNAAAALCRQREGYPVEILGNYCYEIEPSVELYRHGDQLAAMQIAGILEIPREGGPMGRRPG